MEVTAEVGPGIAQRNLTLDAAVECACADVSSDSADGMHPITALLMMVLMLLIGGGTLSAGRKRRPA